MAFGVRFLRRLFLRLRWELKLRARVWWKKGRARLGLFSRGYGEWEALS
jgi:hypothetical protein